MNTYQCNNFCHCAHKLTSGTKKETFLFVQWKQNERWIYKNEQVLSVIHTHTPCISYFKEQGQCHKHRNVCLSCIRTHTRTHFHPLCALFMGDHSVRGVGGQRGVNQLYCVCMSFCLNECVLWFSFFVSYHGCLMVSWWFTAVLYLYTLQYKANSIVLLRNYY